LLLFFLLLLFVFAILAILKGNYIIPHQQSWIVERFGRFHRELHPGLNWIVPFIDTIAYRHSLKEEVIDVQEQMAFTNDNVSVKLDGILYVKIIDPIKASYGVKNPHYAITQLVQTTMRSEIGKLTLDRTFEERELLNIQVSAAINQACISWGISCLRYEIKDIIIPSDIKKSMELQMTAERQKRAKILESEGTRQAEINISEGKKSAEINNAEAMRKKKILQSEAELIEKLNNAKAQAETILQVARSTAEAVRTLSQVIHTEEGEKALAFKVANEYIEAFKQLAKKSTTLILPSQPHDISHLVGQGMSIYDLIKKKTVTEKGVCSLKHTQTEE
jgi:regulator of protease activity HflC (stomatin/prohibitin superfamily)